MPEEAAASSGIDVDMLDDEEQAMACFADAVQGGAAVDTSLRRAIARYPAQAMLLADYAAHLHTNSGKESENVAEMEMLVEQVAAAKAARRVSEWNGILARLKDLARSPMDVCRRLHIGRSVLTKLDRRLIDFDTMPRAFLQALCEELQTTRDALSAFLSAGPRLSAASEYRSKGVPSAGRKESFRRAIDASVGAGELDASEADTWLAEKRDPI